MRYYISGDQKEGEPDLYFCAQCDQFVPSEHFQPADHSGRAQTPFERYLWDKKRLPTYMKNTKGMHHRPKCAVNCLE